MSLNTHSHTHSHTHTHTHRAFPSPAVLISVYDLHRDTVLCNVLIVLIMYSWNCPYMAIHAEKRLYLHPTSPIIYTTTYVVGRSQSLYVGRYVGSSAQH